ncbi:hypothetical protein RKD54_004528 [Pseudarthrobacter sp. SLBN-100]
MSTAEATIDVNKAIVATILATFLIAVAKAGLDGETSAVFSTQYSHEDCYQRLGSAFSPTRLWTGSSTTRSGPRQAIATGANTQH